MKLSYRFLEGFVLFSLLFFACFNIASAATVGKWQRYVVSAPNGSYTGNPFELEINATFTHTASGFVISLPGYYAGNDIWKVGFMPTKTGEWTYKTSSLDPDLDGIAGSITCIESGLPGILDADPDHPKKWKFTDGSYVVPIGVFVQLMQSNATTVQFEGMADFLKNNNLQLINFRLCEQDICFSSVANLEMDLARWDRLEERLEILTERGMGVEIMLYTDDGGRPSYGARSNTEKFLIRYMISRLASFPMVIFNTGIDIWEYRDSSWHDWYGNLIKSIDPYGHPVSSRGATGSDTSFMSAGLRTYNSNGARNSEIRRLIGAFNAADVPSINTDNWGEDRGGINGHTPADIRRAGWKTVVAGGVGFHVRDNKNNDCANGVTANCDTPFSVSGIQNDFDSEQWLKLVNPFVQSRLGETFGKMVPDSSLVSNGYALADPGRSKILYLLIGDSDSWDSGNGGAITVRLADLTGNYTAAWFDTRTGTETKSGFLASGTNHIIDPPSADDWLLLITKLDATNSAPLPPVSLRIVE